MSNGFIHLGNALSVRVLALPNQVKDHMEIEIPTRTTFWKGSCGGSWAPTQHSIQGYIYTNTHIFCRNLLGKTSIHTQVILIYNNLFRFCEIKHKYIHRHYTHIQGYIHE